MDVAALKTISLVLTGAFGILGALTETRDKETKKVTKWGYLSLIGILVSTMLGVATQLKESSDDAKKALELAKRSDRMLTEINRGLHSLAGAILTATFFVSGKAKLYERFCNWLSSERTVNAPRSEWKGWPPYEHFVFSMWVLSGKVVIADDKDIMRRDRDSLLTFVLGDKKAQEIFAVRFPPTDKNAMVELTATPDIISNQGQIQSLVDFHGVNNYSHAFLDS